MLEDWRANFAMLSLYVSCQLGASFKCCYLGTFLECFSFGIFLMCFSDPHFLYVTILTCFLYVPIFSNAVCHSTFLERLCINVSTSCAVLVIFYYIVCPCFSRTAELPLSVDMITFIRSAFILASFLYCRGISSVDILIYTRSSIIPLVSSPSA